VVVELRLHALAHGVEDGLLVSGGGTESAESSLYE
jgi:hypothetical protein